MTSIVFNGTERLVPDGVNVQDLLRLTYEQTTGLAVSVNGAVVPRARWPETIVRERDEIEVLTAVQGG
ncbi:MAG: sulfur carrier protein ThiS [Acidothermus sp.]|nr:sulfur carrier protein ThiS [Acidothermus sp.]